MFIFTPNQKSQTDVGELRKVERDWSLNWGEMHGYRDRMQYPELPRGMSASKIHESVQNYCTDFFHGIEKCIDHGRATEHPKRPFERMAGCKTQWFKFDRCVRQRDRRIMDAITQWESDHVSHLKPDVVPEYLEHNIDKRVRYLQYMSDQSSTQQKAVYYERHKGFLLDRGIAVRTALSIPLSREEEERVKLVRSAAGKESDLNIIIKSITSRLQNPEKHRADAPPY
jgi:hypothetical protein